MPPSLSLSVCLSVSVCVSVSLSLSQFVSYVASFYCISLCETFVETFQSSLFPEHTLFCCPALKLSTQGRRSGGVVVLIRTKLLPLVRQLDCKHDNMLLFVIDKECFGLLKDVLLMCVYVPPAGSPYYNVTGTDNGIQLSSDVHVLLCGDLNARTADTPYEVNSSFQLLDVHCHKATNLLTRNSEDSEENGYGKMLLNMCSAFGLCILNGTCKGDLHCRYTYVTGLGCSVIDYFIASEELYYELLLL